MSEEEKKAVEYYQDKDVSFSVDFDTEKLLKTLGITEEDSFENHQIRFKTLLNLIKKLQKENEELKYKYDKKLSDVVKEIQKEYNKLDEQIDEYLNNDNKDLSGYYENKERVSTMQTLSWVVDNLRELIESEEK